MGRVGRSLLVVALSAAPAAAQDVTIEGVARSVSLMKQIAETCSGDFDVDRALAERAQEAFTRAGETGYGKKAFAKALGVELPRRAQEVRSTGSDRWCADQRERMADVPGPKLFRK